MELLKGGMTIQMAVKSLQKMQMEASRPPVQTIPVLLAEQVGGALLHPLGVFTVYIRT